MHVKLFLLGGVRAESNGAALAGRAVQRRRLALLALLALSPRRTLTRERVIAYLWPEHASESARRLLSESLYVIRHELGDETIASVGDELTLSSAVECDVDEFTAALAAGDGVRAAGVYGGPFLDAWFVRDAPEFERWSESERVRLATMYARTLRTLADADEHIMEWTSAASWWQALIRLDPYSSTAVLRAARVLALAGEPAAAIQTLTAHEALLHEELGVGPDGELVELLRQIRAGELAPHRRSPPSMERVDWPEVSARRTPAPMLSQPRERSRWVRFARVGAVLASLAVGAWTMMSGSSRNSSAASMGSSPQGDLDDRRRIAVLYFEDRSTDQRLGYLADGLTEYLIDELSRSRGLKVISADAVRRMRNTPLDSVARTLQVRTVVRARVEQSGQTIRVSAQLIDARSEEQVRVVKVEAPVGELFALQDQLSSQLGAELIGWVGRDVRLTEARAAARTGARSNRALELVLRAQRLRKDAEEARVGQRTDSGAIGAARLALLRAESLLVQAEALDRTWAIPPIERAMVALFSARLENGTVRVMTLAPGLAHAERALSLADDVVSKDSSVLARALFVRGLIRIRSATAVQTFRPESTMIRMGERDVERAVSYDSTLASAWAALAVPRWLRGDFTGVERVATAALQADAYLEEAPDVIGWAWHAANARGDVAEATRWCTRGHQLMPGNWHFVECELTIMKLDVAGLSGRRPDTARAWALVRQLEQMDPAARARTGGHPYSPYFRQMLAAMVSAAAGDRTRARETLTRLRKETSGDAELSTDLLYESACLQFVLGERDAGERALAAYVRARPDVAGFIDRDASVRRLRVATR